MRRFTIILSVVALLAAACSSDEGGDTTTTTTTPIVVTSSGGAITAVAERFDPSTIRFVAALDRPGTCDAVLDRFKAEALERVGPYGLQGGGGWFPGPMPVDARGLGGDDGDFFLEEAQVAVPETTVTTIASSSGLGTDYSGTNVQVTGVDEPDIVKTDGERIYAIVEGRLVILDVDGGSATRLGALQLDGGWDHRMLLAGDSLYVFTRADVWALPEVFAADARILPEYGTPSSLVYRIDVSDPRDPQITRTLRIDGGYLSARSIDGVIRVVVSSYPAQLPFVYPSGPAAEDFAEQANRQVIQQSTIEDWLPAYSLADGGTIVQQGLLADCEQVHFPAEFGGFSSLSVLTIDTAGGLSAGGAATVVADGETVYASTESLYVATSVWVPGGLAETGELDELQESWSTALHRFDISGSGPAEYVASGSVDGHLLNQFSMDEYEGRLRVAVTEGPPWGFDEQSESSVVVLATEGDRLVQVGRVGDLGRGERIFSARFVGDVAYVVTFRQVDPLYVIDLSDPENPAVAGELKIPGYSSYLHPLGDGLVLGVGQDADSDGRTRGAKVSLFDVSDPADPVEVDVWSLSDASTDVEWDHLAFLYWAPRDMAVLPLQVWRDGFSGAVVLGTADGLDERGRITHADRVVDDPGCDPIPADQLQRWVDDEGIVVQVCGADDPGGGTGLWCESWDAETARELAFEFLGEDEQFDLADDERIEVCWPDYEQWSPPILRSLVIGDTLWTMTTESLQGNDIETLQVTESMGL